MMNETSLEQISKETLKYITELDIQSLTVLESNALTADERDNLADDINQMRLRGKSHKRQINIKPDFLRLDFNETLYLIEHRLEGVQTTKRGNCSETACLGLKFVHQHFPKMRVEIFSIKDGDHVFLVLNRALNSHENNPLTWGDAIILDTHYKNYFNANEYKTKLKTFEYERNKDNNTHRSVLKDFNPDIHLLIKEEHNDDEFDSAFLNGFNSPENIKILTNYFKTKLMFLKFLLNNLKNGLEEINAGAAPNQDVEKRIKEITELLEEIEKVKKLTLADTQENYFSKKELLSEHLKILFSQTQEILSPFNKTHVFNKTTAKNMAGFNFLLFKNKIKNFPITRITTQPDDAIAYAKKTLENFIDDQTDKRIIEMMVNNPADSNDSETYIYNAIEKTFIDSSLKRSSSFI